MTRSLNKGSSNGLASRAMRRQLEPRGRRGRSPGYGDNRALTGRIALALVYVTDARAHGLLGPQERSRRGGAKLPVSFEGVQIPIERHVASRHVSEIGSGLQVVSDERVELAFRFQPSLDEVRASVGLYGTVGHPDDAVDRAGRRGSVRRPGWCSGRARSVRRRSAPFVRQRGARRGLSGRGCASRWRSRRVRRFRRRARGWRRRRRPGSGRR